MGRHLRSDPANGRNISAKPRVSRLFLSNPNSNREIKASYHVCSARFVCVYSGCLPFLSQQSAECQRKCGPQLLRPQTRSPSHSKLSSQSPWPSLHGFFLEQHSLFCSRRPPLHPEDCAAACEAMGHEIYLVKQHLLS